MSLAGGAAGAWAQVDVLTYHNDIARTGRNLEETILTQVNVNPKTFGRLHWRKLDGDVYAQPLVVTGVEVPGKGVHDVVYVATENDTVYAFDAHNKKGKNAKPLWKRTLKPPGAMCVPAEDLACEDLVPKVGITGTPVIDKDTGTLFVVARTKEGEDWFQRLYALDIATGADKVKPVVCDPSAPGTGDYSTDGMVHFYSRAQNQRAGLLLHDGRVYVAWAAHCDVDPYHGWLASYDAGTLEPVAAWCSTPDGQRGGVWQAGCGPSVDAQGRIYVSTGNGTFSGNSGGDDCGDSVIRLTANLAMTDSFTPWNQDVLESFDLDLGSAGVLVLPDQPGPFPRLALASGKEGKLYLLNREDMGGYNPDNDDQIVQSVEGALEHGVFSTMAYFNGKVYVVAAGDVIKSFVLANGKLPPQATTKGTDVFAWPGATVSISADGATNAIAWCMQRDLDAKVPWRLHAYAAQDVGIELFDAGDVGKKAGAGKPIKFAAPTIANGKVYVGGHNRLTVFGLK